VVRIKFAFFPASRPCGDDAVHSIALGEDYDKNTTCVCFSQVESTRFPVPEDCACIYRIVFNYLFCFFRCDAMEGNVTDVADISMELHR
jgi:hypothetical protein